MRTMTKLAEKSAPLSAVEEEELAACAQDMTAGVGDFLLIGKALSNIAGQKLYRATHRSFASYCKARWKLSRRTAYLKMQLLEIYESVHYSTHLLQPNELQLRQLLIWPTTEHP